jgi:ribosomal protein S18 acetylase RimI-like enzyme
MSGAVTLRPCRPDDEAFLYRVYASTREDELAPLDWDQAQKEAFLRMQFTAQHRFYHEQFPDAAYDLVLRDGQPIGRLYVDRRPDEIRILDIALLTEERQAGIGSALLRELLAEAAQARLPVRIHVELYNPALRLYRRLGFVDAGTTGVHLLMEWRGEW